MNCPKCQSKHLQKKGIRSGKQRYRCSECGANFTEGVDYLPAKQYPPIKGIECPQCKSKHIVRDGKLKDGMQRYQCQSCGLNFSPRTTHTSKRLRWRCPYCNGIIVHSGYSKTGNKTYVCKKCGKSCTEGKDREPVKKTPPFNLTNVSVHCPHCNSLNLKKDGYTKYGLQRYECNSCGRAFNENFKEREPLAQVVTAILQGQNIKKVTEDSGYSSEYLRKIMVPYYKKETITTEQKKNIIRYGYFLNVPVNYMAEYIKCSEHKCKEVLKKFKKSIMSTNRDAI